MLVAIRDFALSDKEPGTMHAYMSERIDGHFWSRMFCLPCEPKRECFLGV